MILGSPSRTKIVGWIAVILTARDASKMLALRGRVIFEAVTMIYAHPKV